MKIVTQKAYSQAKIAGSLATSIASEIYEQTKSNPFNEIHLGRILIVALSDSIFDDMPAKEIVRAVQFVFPELDSDEKILEEISGYPRIGVWYGESKFFKFEEWLKASKQ